MPDTLAGGRDTPLSGYSSPLMSSHLSPALASPKGLTLRSTLASTAGHNHRQRHIQYPGMAVRVSPNVLCHHCNRILLL